MSSRRSVSEGACTSRVRRDAKSCLREERSRLVAATRRKSERCGVASPRRWYSPRASSTRSRWACSSAWELAYLVEEEGPSVGRPDEPLALGHPGLGVVGEVAEELGVDERRRQRRGVSRDERPGGARRSAVERHRGELFAGPRLARDEDVGLGGDREGDLLAQSYHGGRFAQDAARVGLPERAQGEGNRAGATRARLSLDAEEHDGAAERDHVADGDGARGDAGAVDAQDAAADLLDVDGIATGHHLELPARERGRREGLRRLERAAALPEEAEPRIVVFRGASAEHDGRRAARERGDLSDSPGLVSAPGDHEGRHGVLATVAARLRLLLRVERGRGPGHASDRIFRPRGGVQGLWMVRRQPGHTDHHDNALLPRPDPRRRRRRQSRSIGSHRLASARPSWPVHHAVTPQAPQGPVVHTSRDQ